LQPIGIGRSHLLGRLRRRKWDGEPLPRPRWLGLPS
jgi:hypothetical protein